MKQTKPIFLKGESPALSNVHFYKRLIEVRKWNWFLTLRVSIPEEEVKISLFSTILCGSSKRFMKALKAFIKPLRHHKIEINCYFNIFLKCTGRKCYAIKLLLNESNKTTRKLSTANMILPTVADWLSLGILPTLWVHLFHKKIESVYLLTFIWNF